MQVDIQTLLSPIWQADNPWINPASLFKELNWVMKKKIQQNVVQIEEITTELVSLKENNALVNRCNEGLFFQMQQDQERHEKQLKDISKQVKTLESKISN